MPRSVLMTPYITEKSMNHISGTPIQSNTDGNRLEFIVRRDSTKPEIKEAFERRYEQELLANDIPKENILKIPIVFAGKEPYLLEMKKEE